MAGLFPVEYPISEVRRAHTDVYLPRESASRLETGGIISHIINLGPKYMVVFS